MAKIKYEKLRAEMTAKTKAENKVLNNLWRFVYNRRSPANKTKVYPASELELQLKIVHVDYKHSKISGEVGVDHVYFEAEPSEDASKN